MIVRINIEFKNDDLKYQFLTETILKTVLKSYGFHLINFIKINQITISLIYENKKYNDDDKIRKMLNCFPDSDGSLGIKRYGWSLGLIPFELVDASFYKDRIQWDYKHGLCSYKLKFT